SYGPENLANQNSRWRILGEELRCGCRNDRDPESLKRVMASEPHGKVVSESIGRLHEDCLCSVRCQMSQHLSKAGALIDWIGTAHRRIVVLAHQGEAGTLGKGFDDRDCGELSTLHPTQ